MSDGKSIYEINGECGYFHTCEHSSKPIELEISVREKMNVEHISPKVIDILLNKEKRISNDKD